MKLTTRQIGASSEAAALKLLKRNGYKLLSRNYSTRAGELDLVVRKDASLVFVEVRYRSNIQFGTGAESVNWHKQQRLIRAAEHYLQHEVKDPDIYTEFRFDVVSIGEDVEWIQHAFTLD